MATKTATRPKAAPKAEVPTPPAAPKAPVPVATPKPRARAAAPKKKKADTIVAAAGPESTHTSVGPTEDEIRVRAYHRYLERGGGHGMHFDDWLEAKRELRELTEKR